MLNGHSCRFHSGHRYWILYEMLFCDEALSREEKLFRAFRLIFIDDLREEDIPAAEEFILWFHSCGKPENYESGDDTASCGPAFSYEYDDGYIFAAFLSQYRIDLRTAELHWWEFKALFRSLEQDRRFSEITGFRTMQIPSEMSSAMKNYYYRMKERYAIPMSESDRQELDELTAALMNGGDISGLI